MRRLLRNFCAFALILLVNGAAAWAQTAEINNFNWGNPATNYDPGTFGQITSLAGDPRILQFGVKYAF